MFKPLAVLSFLCAFASPSAVSGSDASQGFDRMEVSATDIHVVEVLSIEGGDSGFGGGGGTPSKAVAQVKCLRTFKGGDQQGQAVHCQQYLQALERALLALRVRDGDVSALKEIKSLRPVENDPHGRTGMARIALSCAVEKFTGTYIPHYTMAFIDLAIGLFIVISVWFSCEWLIRRRAARKGA